MSTPTVYLVTGTNRGVGLAFVRLLTTRPDVIVYATARKVDGAAELRALADGSDGKVRLLELSYGDEESNAAAAARVKSEVGRLDVVIANAGLLSHLGPLVDMPAQALREHLEVNTIGPLVLFKAIYPLLNAARGKFIVISSALGAEMGANTPIGFTAYGTSKAAVNFLVRRINTECPDITSFLLHPGLVDTGMGDFAAKLDSRVGGAPKLSPAESARGMLEEVIDSATREVRGGKLWGKDGGKWAAIPW